MEEVSRVRTEIDRIDEELVLLLKARYELAKQVGRIKKTQGLGIRDLRREHAILREVRKIASANSLPTGPIRRIFIEVFNLSVEAQRPRNVWRDLQGLEVLVAGGTGGMGRLFAGIFANHGASVRIFGRTDTRNRKVAREIGVLPGKHSDARQADIVIVSVPMDTTLRLSLKLGSIMKPESILADLSSVKTGIADLAEKGTEQIEYVSLHPLFGPDIAHIGRQQIAAIPYRAGILWKKLQLVFREEGARVILTTLREHDMMMAHIQAIQHFALISLGMTIGKTTGEFATRSFRATEDQIRRIVKNWDTIVGIQRLNPFASQEREDFRSTVNNIAAMSPADSRMAFRVLKGHVQKWSRKQ